MHCVAIIVVGWYEAEDWQVYFLHSPLQCFVFIAATSHASAASYICSEATETNSACLISIQNFICTTKVRWSRNSVVGIATGYELDD
jgi:hypothetical protein